MDEVETRKLLERRLSRRTFIKGVVAAGATATASAYLFRASPLLGAVAQSTGERLLTLTVNGQQRRVDVLPNETLAQTLRYKLGLTGTKVGCDRAECGSCTVLIDGVSHYSCSVLTHTVRSRSVTTIEGLQNPDTGKLHPVQQAVLDEGGFQCAYCAPGFIMAMVELVETTPQFTRDEAARALSGNLCRCADYPKILNSAMRAGELARAARG